MQVAALYGILQGCVVTVRVDPVDVGPVALDQELDYVVMTVDGRDLHPCPPVLGDVVHWLMLRQNSVNWTRL